MSKERPIKYGPKEANLFAAIVNKNTYKAIELMTQEGINLNATNSKGETFLHCAVITSQEEVVGALIQAGVQLGIKDNKTFTPLEYAYANNNQSIINLLVNAHIESIVKLHTESLTDDNNIPQENVINPGSREGDRNIEEEEIAQKDNKDATLIPAQAIKEEKNEGGGEASVPTHSVNNKKSNWAALENFFFTLVNKVAIKVLGLYIPGMPTGASTEKSASPASPTQNQQKYWKSPQENGWNIKSSEHIFGAKLYNLPKFEHNKNSSFTILDSELIAHFQDESVPALVDSVTQE